MLYGKPVLGLFAPLSTTGLFAFPAWFSQYPASRRGRRSPSFFLKTSINVDSKMRLYWQPENRGGVWAKQSAGRGRLPAGRTWRSEAAEADSMNSHRLFSQGVSGDLAASNHPPAGGWLANSLIEPRREGNGGTGNDSW